jgi:hypothetical protein
VRDIRNAYKNSIGKTDKIPLMELKKQGGDWIHMAEDRVK